MGKSDTKKQLKQSIPLAGLLILLVVLFSANNGSEQTTPPKQLDIKTTDTHTQEEEELALGYNSTPTEEFPESEGDVLGVSDLDVTPTNEVVEPKGQIHEYVSQPLVAGEYYSLPVDSPLAISWEGEAIMYSFATSATDIPTELHILDPDGEGEQMGPLLISPLLIPPDGYDFIILHAPSGAQPINVATISPAADTQAAFKPSQLAKPSATGSFNLDSGAKYTTLEIAGRSQWGANTPSWDSNSSTDIDDPLRFVWTPYHYGVSRFVVHHTAGGYDQYTGTEATRLIYLYHAYTRGWGDIGYNYIIDQYGNIFEGKAGGDGVFAYHARTEANQMSIGIAMIGDFTSGTPTTAAMDSLKNLMAEKAILFNIPSLTYSYGSLGSWLNTDYTVFGHRGSHYYDTGEWFANSTACPGNTFVNYLPTLVAQAEAIRSNSANFSQLRAVSEEVDNLVENSPIVEQRIYLEFDLPIDATEAEVLAKIPPYASITETIVSGNTAVITISDWYNGGTSPSPGWSGWPGAEGSFFPPSNGPIDRMGTLLKIFRLRDDVVSADFNLGYTTQGTP